MKFADLNINLFGNTIQLAGAIYQGEGKTLLCFFPEEAPSQMTALVTAPALGVVTADANGPYGAVTLEADGQTLSVELVEGMEIVDWQFLLTQTDWLATEALTQRPDGLVVKAIVRKSQRQIEQGVSWTVYRRDGYSCRYCGRDDVPLTVDHLVCWEEGGPSTVENLLSACRKCNKVRGNTSYADWLQHSYYKKVSQNLSEATRRANELIVVTLADIPRQPVRTR